MFLKLYFIYLLVSGVRKELGENLKNHPRKVFISIWRVVNG